MARNRIIKQDFWTRKSLMNVSGEAQLMLIGLSNFSDDYGVIPDSNRKILGDLFTYKEQITEKQVEAWKKELLKAKELKQFEYEGNSYLFITHWGEDQKVPHPGKETVPKDILYEILMRPSRDPQSQIEREVEIEIKREIETSSNEEGAALENLQEVENIESLPDDLGNTPPVPAAPPTYGRKEINDMLTALKARIEIEAFVDARIERKIAKHCVGLLQKIGKDEFVRRLDYLLTDPFHSKNCNKILYVYNNIKGFKEPQSNTLRV